MPTLLFRTAEEAATCAVEQSAADKAPRYVIESTSQPADRRYRCDTSNAITDGERLVATYRQGETAPDRPLVQPHKKPTLSEAEIEDMRRKQHSPPTPQQIEEAARKKQGIPPVAPPKPTPAPTPPPQRHGKTNREEDDR